MTEEQYSRSELLLGAGATAKLKAAHVAVFGIGGVGSYLVEALVRMGIGEITLIDADTYAPSNLNRQLYATTKTVGQEKTLAAKERIHEIDPSVQVHTFCRFVLPENINEYDFSCFDYVADAIDTVGAKLAIIKACHAVGTPVISAMGAGNKLDPTAFRVADISKTSGCALARIMRKECGKRGLKNIKVVFSEELPLDPQTDGEDIEPQREGSSRRSTPGSVSFVPAVAGLIMAGEVIKDLCQGDLNV